MKKRYTFFRSEGFWNCSLAIADYFGFGKVDDYPIQLRDWRSLYSQSQSSVDIA